MIYFAYGSNINFIHLTEYLDTHGVTLDTELRGQNAYLHNYRLRTNYFASTHYAGACNIKPAQGECVEGIVITITPVIQGILLDHGGTQATIQQNYDDAKKIISDIEAMGINMKDVTDQLTSDGVDLFAQSFDDLLTNLSEKSEQVRATG